MPRTVRELDSTRSLGFRLTAGYLAFFTLLLVLIGLFFHRTLVTLLQEQYRELLEHDWISLEAVSPPDGGRPVWAHDPNDAEECLPLERMRRVFLLADETDAFWRCLRLTASWAGSAAAGPRRSSLTGPHLDQRAMIPGRALHDPLGPVPREPLRRLLLSLGRSMPLTTGTVRQFAVRYFTIPPVDRGCQRPIRLVPDQEGLAAAE